MAHIHIPALLRAATGGRDWVEVDGATVRELVAALELAYPEMQERLVRDGRLVPGLAVAIDGEISATGLSEATGADTEVQFINAIQGG
jgi:molybdopterin converting factor small subunit